MYENMSVDELVEQLQDVSADEAVEMMHELARRYREGIGVDVDLEAARRWEKDTEDLLRDPEEPCEDKSEVATAEESTRSEEVYTQEACKTMNEQELFRAYRDGAPWAIYYLSQKLICNHEENNALSELEELSHVLEGKLDKGESSEELSNLLALTKMQLATLYEGKGEVPENFDKSKRCYEEAALELGCRDAIPGLLRCYRKDGYGKHEKEILPLLRQLEDGDANDRMIAADTYREIGRNTYASILYKGLAQEPGMSDENKLNLTARLMALGAVSDAEIEGHSSNGDGIASWVLARKAYGREDYQEAQKYYEQAVRQGQENAQSELDLLKEKISSIAENKKENESCQKKAPTREDRGRSANSRASHLKKSYDELKVKNPTLAKYIPIGVVICLALIVFSRIPSAVSSAALEEIDPFEDVQVNFVGVAPDAWADVLNNSTNDFLQTVTYTAVPATGLKYGDVVKVTATYSKDEAKEAGYKLTKTTKTYKVDNVDSYVTDISQIDETCRAAMEQQAKDMVEATMANYDLHDLSKDLGMSRYGVYSGSFGEFSQSTSYLLISKPGYEENDINRYIITYEIPIYLYKEYEGVVWDGPAYISVVFCNLTVDTEGVTTVELSKAIRKDVEPSMDNVYTQRVSRFKDQYIVQEYNP